MTPHEQRAVEALCRACRVAANRLVVMEQDHRNMDPKSEEGKYARQTHQALMAAVRRCHKKLGL